MAAFARFLSLQAGMLVRQIFAAIRSASSRVYVPSNLSSAAEQTEPLSFRRNEAPTK